MNRNKKLLYALMCVVTLQAVMPAQASMWTDVSAWWHNVPTQSKHVTGIVVAGLLTTFSLYALWNRSVTKKAVSINNANDALVAAISTPVVAPAPVIVPYKAVEMEHDELPGKVFARRRVEFFTQQKVSTVIAEPEVLVAAVASESLLGQGYETVCHGTPGQAVFVGSPAYVALRQDIVKANFEGMFKEINEDIFGKEDLKPNFDYAAKSIEAMETIVKALADRVTTLYAVCLLETKNKTKTSITVDEYMILINGVKRMQGILTDAKKDYEKELGKQAHEDSAKFGQQKSKKAAQNKKKKEKAKARKQAQEHKLA